MNHKKMDFLFRWKSFHLKCTCSLRNTWMSVYYWRELYRWNQANVEIWWKKYSGTSNSEPYGHLKNNPTYTFTKNVLLAALINDRVRKNLEPLLMILRKSSLTLSPRVFWAQFRFSNFKPLLNLYFYSGNIYLFNVNNRNSRKRYEIC